MNAKLNVRRLIAPIVVLSLSSLIAAALILNKEPVAKKTDTELIRSVTAIQANPEKASFAITSQGAVIPATHIRYLSEVNGKIKSVASNWQDGGYFKQGDVMLTIEDHVYQSQLAKAKAALQQAETLLTQEKALAHVAKKTYESSGRKDDDEASRALALREPQLASAQTQLESAQADVNAAEIMLEKTNVRAPFTGIINNKAVDIGQVIGTGQLLADFYGVAKAEIRVPLTLAQQAYLDLPPLSKTADISVEVIYKTAGETHRYSAKLVRTSGVLDETTRVLHGIILLDDPYNLAQQDKAVLPLGAFVEVNISSVEQANVIQLPSRLLRPGDRIWVVDTDNKLRLRDVKLLPSREKTIYISSGIQPDDRIIVSSIVDAYPGNPVEVTMKESVEN